jgi:glycosyltransferase involved in cell wall biosynthesis
LSNESYKTRAAAEGSDRPRRILHIGKYFPPHRGGMETMLRDQMNMQVRDEGLEVAAVVHSSERRLVDKVKVESFGYRVRHAARWFTAAFAPIAPLFIWSVYREIRTLEPDEIKIHMPNVSAFWLLLLPAAKTKKWIILWHSDVLPSQHTIGLRSLYWLYKPLETLLLKRASLVIATSAAYLNASIPLQPFFKKCVVEPLLIDTERFPRQLLSAPQPSKSSKEGLRVLCIGRLTYYKDFGTVIRAISGIPDAQLRIVGEGKDKNRLIAIILELQLSDRVTLLGDLEDEEVWCQYNWCDVHVLSSIERTEAFGLVILEAAAFGRKNIVSEIDGSGTLSAAQQSGHEYLSFPPRNIEILRQALIKAAP